MNKNNLTTYIDEMIILHLLKEGQADVYDICDKITYFTGDTTKYSPKYTGLLLFRLKQDNLVRKSRVEHIYSLTEKGAEELKERLAFFSEYQRIADRFENQPPKASGGVDFETAFGNFIDRCEYDKAENALFAIVRSAFTSGWNTAGGKAPKPQPVIELIKS